MAQKNPIVSDSDIPMRKVSSASSSPIDFCQVPPPFVPVKYTSISKGFGESKKSYLMCKCNFNCLWSKILISMQVAIKLQSTRVDIWKDGVHY